MRPQGGAVETCPWISAPQIQQAAERPERNFVDTRQLKVSPADPCPHSGPSAGWLCVCTAVHVWVGLSADPQVCCDVPGVRHLLRPVRQSAAGAGDDGDARPRHLPGLVASVRRAAAAAPGPGESSPAHLTDGGQVVFVTSELTCASCSCSTRC